VEQHPEEIWSSQQQTIQEALAKAGMTLADVAALGITNQRESTIAWHRDTGKALGPAINWQCRRTADFCNELKQEGFDRVLIVTSDYHLPRSLLEMRARMPDVELVAYPVRSPRPWTDVHSARRWVLEYLKFTAVWVRYSVSNPHA